MLASMKTRDGDECYILFEMSNTIGKVYFDEMLKLSFSEIADIDNEASESCTMVSYQA